MSEETSATGRRTQAGRQSIVGTEPVAYVRNKYERLSWALDERQRRLWAANEAVALGYGGCRVVAEATTGMSDRTVPLGLRELQQRWPEVPSSTARGRIRRPGGGRPSAFR